MYETLSNDHAVWPPSPWESVNSTRTGKGFSPYRKGLYCTVVIVVKYWNLLTKTIADRLQPVLVIHVSLWIRDKLHYIVGLFIVHFFIYYSTCRAFTPTHTFFRKLNRIQVETRLLSREITHQLAVPIGLSSMDQQHVYVLNLAGEWDGLGPLSLSFCPYIDHKFKATKV